MNPNMSIDTKQVNWQLVAAFVKDNGGRATVKEIEDFLTSQKRLASNARPEATMLSVNLNSRVHYGGGKEVRRSQEIRSFLGGRHENDKGLYVSTGGFTKDARYEAERARIPVTLMDLDDLVKSLLEHYEKMDIDMQRLIPLRKVYWPA